VIGMSLAQLRHARRVVGVAGGSRKTAAIRGALLGKLINVLITDGLTARRLIAESGLKGPDEMPQPRRSHGAAEKAASRL
jgi:hypothetical protein